MNDLFMKVKNIPVPKFLKVLIKSILLKRKGIITSHPEAVPLDLNIESPVFLGNVRIGKNVEIGKYTYINSGSIFSNVKIGRYCSLAYNVVIAPHNHPTNWLSTHPFQYDRKYNKYIKHRYEKFEDDAETIIGNDVWIGANTFIKRGISIGDGAIIGAGAVVTKDVPPYAIVGGVPAKIIKYRFDKEIIDKLLTLKWWEKEEKIIWNLPFEDIKQCIEILESKAEEENR